MATLTSGISGQQYGIENDEVSCVVEDFTVRVAPQFIAMQTDKVNNAKGRAVGALMANISLTGVLNASSLGVLATTFTAAATLANDIDYHGLTTGDVMMEESTIKQRKDGFKTIEQSFTRHAGVDD